MRDAIALMGDEFWPRLDDVKQVLHVLHTAKRGWIQSSRFFVHSTSKTRQCASVTKL
jgi:hypothetical protein